MPLDLSRTLHALTARLDRAADRIVQAECGLPYRRFLALYGVAELGEPTQRALAEWVGVTEPSMSRMTQVLARDGHIEVVTVPGGGNRRRIRLSVSGRGVVASVGTLLEQRFAELVAAANVSYAEYQTSTNQVLETLTRDQKPSIEAGC